MVKNDKSNFISALPITVVVPANKNDENKNESNNVLHTKCYKDRYHPVFCYQQEQTPEYVSTQKYYMLVIKFNTGAAVMVCVFCILHTVRFNDKNVVSKLTAASM